MMLKILTCFYQLLWGCAPPILRYYLRKRGKVSPDYLKHWDERFGKTYSNPVRNAIWVHAVSVGETRAAEPLINALKKYYPRVPLLITFTTPTGRSTAKSLFPHAQCRYLPYDKKNYINLFLSQHQPKMGILMETEIWPNLLNLSHQHHIPVFLANARLSVKSQQGYLKIASLVKNSLNNLRACFAQSIEDAHRLATIGAVNIQVCGNTKYDIKMSNTIKHVAQTFKKNIHTHKPIVVCASTRTLNGIDEAELILQAWKKQADQAILIIIPRHPERFQSNYNFAFNMGYKTQKRSENFLITDQTQIIIGDSMGELLAYYMIANIAFVGGSLVNTGCQNMIEPIFCHIPTLFGPSTFNFKETARNALQLNVAKQVKSTDDLINTLIYLLHHPHELNQMTKNASLFINQYQGASQKIAQHIHSILNNSMIS